MRAVPLASLAFLVAFSGIASAQTLQIPPPQTQPVPGMPRPGQPPRDVQRQPVTGTARIKGRVMSAEGLPLRRAMIRASAQDVREGRSTMTDGQGAYELKELPAGRYSVTAMKGGYVTMQFGQRRPFEPGRPIELADGQVLEKTDFTLPRGSVIAGRVMDEFGEPAADAMVQAMRYQFMGGQRRLIPAGRSAPANDLGQFRIYGLPPGDYYVSASLRMGMPFMDASDTSTGYAPTYYPGTPSVGEAQRVTVTVGQELTSVDFGLIPTRTSRITGTARDSRGRPVANAMLMMVQMTGPGAFIEIKRLQGRRLFRVMGIPGWTLKAVLNGGADVTDTAMDFRGADEVTGMQIVLTSQMTEMSGTVADGRGRTARA
jgi:hypothetical protein